MSKKPKSYRKKLPDIRPVDAEDINMDKNTLTFVITADTSPLHDLMRQFGSLVRIALRLDRGFTGDGRLTGTEFAKQVSKYNLPLISKTVVNHAWTFTDTMRKVNKERPVVFGRQYRERLSRIASREIAEGNLDYRSSYEYCTVKAEYKNSRLDYYAVGVSGTNARLGRTGSRFVGTNFREGYVFVYIHGSDEPVKVSVAPFSGGAERYNILLMIESYGQSRELPVTFRFRYNKLCVSVDMERLYKLMERDGIAFSSFGITCDRRTTAPIPGRVMGIDDNPLYMGIAILQDGKPIARYIFDSSPIYGNMENMSQSKLQNKMRHSKMLCAKDCIEIANRYGVSNIIVEDLTIVPSDKKKGKKFNRLINNLWYRTQFRSCLVKHGNAAQIPITVIDPAFTSVMGCMNYPNEVDSVGAAIEIADRGSRILAGEKVTTLPEKLDPNSVPEKYRDKARNFTSWDKFYREYISEVKFRLLFHEISTEYRERIITEERIKGNGKFLLHYLPPPVATQDKRC